MAHIILSAYSWKRKQSEKSGQTEILNSVSCRETQYIQSSYQFSQAFITSLDYLLLSEELQLVLHVRAGLQTLSGHGGFMLPPSHKETSSSVVWNCEACLPVSRERESSVTLHLPQQMDTLLREILTVKSKPQFFCKVKIIKLTTYDISGESHLTGNVVSCPTEKTSLW